MNAAAPIQAKFDHFPLKKSHALAFLGLAFTAGYAWRAYSARRAFVVPGSRSTIPDEEGHYDMDGVSFDDHCGVVVGSDGRTPRVKAAEKPRKPAKMPRSAL